MHPDSPEPSLAHWTPAREAMLAFKESADPGWLEWPLHEPEHGIYECIGVQRMGYDLIHGAWHLGHTMRSERDGTEVVKVLTIPMISTLLSRESPDLSIGSMLAVIAFSRAFGGARARGRLDELPKCFSDALHHALYHTAGVCMAYNPGEGYRMSALRGTAQRPVFVEVKVRIATGEVVEDEDSPHYPDALEQMEQAGYPLERQIALAAAHAMKLADQG